MIPVSNYRKTFSGLVTQTQGLLLDWYAERWPVARVKAAINDSMVDLAVKHRLCLDSVTVALVPGVMGYDVRAMIEGLRDAGSTIRSFAGFDRVTLAGVVVQPGSAEEFFTSRPPRWTADLTGFGKLIMMTPPERAENLTVGYVGYPTPMEDDEDAPDPALPPCDDALCFAAASSLLLEGNLDEVKRAMEYAALFRRETGRVLSGLSKKGVFDDMRPL